MRIKYIGRRPREIAGPRRLIVQPGEVFEVGDALGNALLRQTRRYQPVAEPKPKTAPKVKPETDTKEHSDGNA